MTTRTRAAVSALLLPGLLLACGDDEPTAPADDAPRDETELRFVRFPDSIFPRAQREGSFWAVAGEHRELVLRYEPDEPGEEAEEFLELDVPANALLRRPDGTAFEEGDSIRITVRVDDAARFLFRFEPSGLVFDPDHAAELEVTYRRAGDDLDDDGDVDDDDREFERDLRLWRQESPGDPWEPLGTLQLEELDEVEADITGFTGFALAS